MFAITDEDLEPLIARELASSKVQHEEKFESKEQADEILFEEISEANIDMTMMLLDYSHGGDKHNNYLERHAIDGIKELIQVVAMCRKWKESGI